MGKMGLAIIALLASTQGVQAEPDQYLCITEHSAGIHYNQQSKTWGPTVFTPGTKWLLRRLKGQERQGEYQTSNPKGAILEGQRKEPDKSEWGFFNFGQNVPLTACDVAFNCLAPASSDFILHFNAQTLRFELSSVGDYYLLPLLAIRPTNPDPQYEQMRRQTLDHPRDSGTQIGTCSAF